MKILLFGLFGCGNLGNDGSLEAMVTSLRRRLPDAEIVVTCYDAANVEPRLDVATLPLARSHTLSPRVSRLDRMLLRFPSRIVDLFAAVSALGRSDMMIVPGTGFLDDYGERFYGMPLTIFLWTLAARLVGTKIAFVSIGAGPIRNRLSRFLMLQAARLAHYRSYRDEISRSFMKSYGLDTSGDGVFPDLVFGLPAPGRASPQRAPGEKLTVGVGVMNYSGWKRFGPEGGAIYTRYVDKLVAFVAWLLDQGHDVRLLTGEMNDQVAVDDVMKGVLAMHPDTARSRIGSEPAYSLEDVLRQLSGTDIAVVSRFHNVVCAIMTEVPVVSLSYAPKNDVLLESVGLGEFREDIEQFKVERLKSRFLALAAEREAHAVILQRRFSDFRESLLSQEDAIFAMVSAAAPMEVGASGTLARKAAPD
ncbi:polysaccharide pyruvyl transferase family protein [Oricola thermophila]|uniref:Polysaccharide pyruvyl transferase family protein n=1 Tax=Oricola thermophila TaxID=2742145 RepID=A0A6N1VEB8_9HYPH|nr:polysaccharide pyruvyl transferase family protein [Oricola thermophila]QKV17935.1 polysaccharide pyruvyl transferase family protein [Oricola thermophila]